MSSRLVAVTRDARDPAALAEFWGALLDVVPAEDGRSHLVPGSPTQLGLRFVVGEAEIPGSRRTHLHVTSPGLDDQERQVRRAMELGARPHDVGQLPGEGHVVLADPEGNDFCVIEFGNGFLEGCGPLGEIAGDGTREVGLFWAEALDWPLVWDENGETAIQSSWRPW